MAPLTLKTSLPMVWALFSSLTQTLANPLPKGPWESWGGPQCGAKSVYFMTNEAENSIIAIGVGSDGLLTTVANTVSTGGAGGAGLNSTNMPAGPDSLGSQGSLQVLGDLLFAVNPGSSTLSTFQIDPRSPSSLSLAGSPNWTGGDFPISVCASEALGLVCVANTGAASGVSCAKYGTDGSVSAFDALRPFELHQTTPPSEPLNGLCQVFFSEDQTQLITIVKGNGSSTDPSLVTTFAVDVAAKSVSYNAVSVSPAGSKVLFGTVNIPNTNNLLASDAAFGALILNLEDLATPLALTNITDQKATCWATFSEVTGTGFVDDVIVSQLTEIDVSTGEIVAIHPNNNGGQGLVDLMTVNSKIYALAPGDGTVPSAVTVFDVSGGKGSAHSVQNFVVPGTTRFSEGMGVYVSCPGHW